MPTELLRYDTAEYAGNRLNESIVTHKDQPVRVLACGGGENKRIVVSVEYLNTGNKSKIPLEDIDLTPVKLGFVNTNRGIGYLARISLRKDWKQGLRMNNLRSCFGVGIDDLRDIDLYRVIKGKYPSFNTALENTVCDGIPRAFSRNFAIAIVNDTPSLFYKWAGIVGTIENGRPKIATEFEYLLQELEGSI